MRTTFHSATPQGGDFSVDPTATHLEFVARHVLVARVHGHFEEFWGKAHLDLHQPGNSWVKVDIQAASVTTDNARRDDHLRSRDFLDVAAHPVISYRSLRVCRISDTTFKIVGDLTIRGVTRMLPLLFEYAGSTTDDDGRLRMAFHCSAVISRHRWGITWNETLERGGVVVGDRVTIELDVSVVRTAPQEQQGQQAQKSPGRATA